MQAVQYAIRSLLRTVIYRNCMQCKARFIIESTDNSNIQCHVRWETCAEWLNACSQFVSTQSESIPRHHQICFSSCCHVQPLSVLQSLFWIMFLSSDLLRLCVISGQADTVCSLRYHIVSQNVSSSWACSKGNVIQRVQQLIELLYTIN